MINSCLNYGNSLGLTAKALIHLNVIYACINALKIMIVMNIREVFKEILPLVGNKRTFDLNVNIIYILNAFISC